MAYVIAEPCIGAKDTACLDACPVDAIHPGANEAGAATVAQLYINPDDCICCGVCVPACPVGAIYEEGDLPEKWKHYTQINRDWYARSNSGKPNTNPDQRTTSADQSGPRFRLQ